MTIDLTKTQIRQACLARRKTLSRQFITDASQQITENIQNLQAYQTAQHIAGYLSIQGEVDLSLLWQIALEKGKHYYLPAIQADKTLLFLPYTATTHLISNRYGILEPAFSTQHAIAPHDLDIIILPVVAFNAARTRLGTGGGYYDRTLAQTHGPILIGVAYEWQKQVTLPCDPWDIQPDIILTEQKIYSAQ